MATPPPNHARLAACLLLLGSIAIGLGGTPPSILTPPDPQTVPAGSTVSFSVVAVGDAPLGYRWRTNGLFINGSTNGPAVMLSNVQVSAQISVAISNAFGAVTSASVSLTVTSSPTPPAFTLQPTNQAVPYGGTAQFRVAANGSPVPVYRWYHDDLPFGSNSTLLSIFNVTSTNVGAYFCTASNASGTVTSQVATLTIVTNPPGVTNPPVFTLQPTNPTVPYGGTAIFRVIATGNPTPVYRWFYYGAPFGVTNGPLLVIPNVTAANAGPYFCTASNTSGMATSEVATLTVVSNPPMFTLQPANLVIPYGGTNTLNVLASGSPSPVYRWFHNDEPAGSANGPSLLILGATPAHAGAYFCTASNASGTATSQVATVVIVTNPPVFTVQPINQTVPYGGMAQFWVMTSGSTGTVYRWFHEGVPVGVNSTVLSLFNVTQADAGSYFCTVSNAFGTATSQVATLTVVIDPPVFTIQPTSRTAYPGGSAELSVAASGSFPLMFRWFHNDVPLPTTNSSSYLYFFNVTLADAGSYYCVASNISGVATSQVATLTVVSVPPVISGLADTNVFADQTLHWRFGLSNPPVTLWLVFGQTNVVQTITTYYPIEYFSLPYVQPDQAGQYFFIASNEFGMSTSQVATLTVSNIPLSVTLTLLDPDPVEGSLVRFTATVQGTPAPYLYLYHDGNLVPPIPQYRSWYSGWYLNPIGLQDAGNYTVVASNGFSMATSTVHLTVSRAGPLDKWTIRNPLPQGRDLHGVVWGAGKFVAVGDNGALVTSPDGTNWTARNTHTAEIIHSVSYGNGRFVAVTRYGTGLALTSTNGENWDSALVQSNADFADVTFGNGNFLAVGDIGSPYTPVAFRSTNGINWNPVTIPLVTDAFVLTATFGAGRFLAVDYNGFAYSSTDLISWTHTATNIVPYVPYWAGSAYVNGGFVVVLDDGYLNSSADGLTWGPFVYNGATGKSLHGVSYGAGRYIVVASKGKIITSTGNFQSWSSVVSPTADRLEDVTFANNLFVAVGENGTILTSSDGLSWSNQTRGVNFDLDGLGVGNGLAVAVGKDGTILTSTNGATWNYRPTPGFTAELHGVAYGDGKWVAVGESTNILTSADGATWEVQSPGVPFTYLKSVLYANGLWVAVGVAGQIITSPDALTWTVQTPPYAVDLNEITFGNGLFVAVGDGNYQAVIWTSPDGVTWTDHTNYGPGKNARAIAFANGLYTLGLNDGIIIYGTNATAGTGTNYPIATPLWHYASTGVEGQGNNLRGLTWSNGLWVAVGNNGQIITCASTNNPQTWRKRSTPTYENLHAVRFINNTFIAIGNEGMILQSAPLVSQLCVEKRGDHLHFIFTSPLQGDATLQETEDFTWHTLTVFSNVLGTVEFDLPVAPGSGQRFYRVLGPLPQD